MKLSGVNKSSAVGRIPLQTRSRDSTSFNSRTCFQKAVASRASRGETCKPKSEEKSCCAGAGDRLPNIAALQETLRRRRATSAPAQQLFSSMLGLQVSPRLAREATAFWKQVREIKDVEARDRVWSGILPTADDLLNAESYMKSLEIPDDLSGLL